METIRIDVGVYTALSIDLSGFDFTGIEKVIWTVKNFADDSEPVLIRREYTESKVYNEIIMPEESRLLKGEPVYDFIQVMIDGSCYKVGDNGRIVLSKGVGECP